MFNHNIKNDEQHSRKHKVIAFLNIWHWLIVEHMFQQNDCWQPRGQGYCWAFCRRPAVNHPRNKAAIRRDAAMDKCINKWADLDICAQ